MVKKKKKARFGLLSESGKWCRPPGLIVAWKDPWLITGDDLVPSESPPNPLTETELGKKLEETARQETSRLQGAFSPRYRHHRPNRDQELIVRIQSLFELFSKEATNRTFSHLIGQNILVIAALQAVREEEHQKVMELLNSTLRMGISQKTEGGRARYHTMVEEVCPRNRTSRSWGEALKLEMEISQLALQRLKSADQARYLVELEATRGNLTFAEEMVLNALFEEYRTWRGEIARLVLKVNEVTGSRDFLQRHRYELWDIVDVPVLNDYE